MIGQRVNNYEICRLLGEGGMGNVYLAEHPILGRKAAIKFLKPEFASNTDLVQRFINEARAANAIRHPNIIDIIDVGILPPDDTPYMMMEFLEGESLAERLERAKTLSLADGLHFAGQIASALAAAHAAGIVHRDLKPANIFLLPDSQGSGLEKIKVLDFGIAKLHSQLMTGTPRTNVGSILGTPEYMSPEQHLGQTAEIDHRADIYALGVIVYEMLCGQRPFDGPSAGALSVQHVTVPPKPPRSLNPSIPPAIETVILQALEKKAKDRIASMEVFGAMLAGKPTAATLVLDAGKGAERPATAVDERRSDGGSDSPASATRPERAGRRGQIGSSRATTLSSASGQMRRHVDDEGPRRGKGVRIGVAAALGAAVIAIAVVLGIKLSGKSDGEAPEAASIRPIPAASTVGAPPAPRTAISAPAQPEVRQEPPSAPAAAEETPPSARTEETEPTKVKTISGRRVQENVRAVRRGESTGEPGARRSKPKAPPREPQKPVTIQPEPF